MKRTSFRVFRHILVQHAITGESLRANERLFVCLSLSRLLSVLTDKLMV